MKRPPTNAAPDERKQLMLTESLPTTAADATRVGPAPLDLPTRDWRPRQRAKAIALIAGGGVYALSHALNLLGSTPDLSSPAEIASKYLFGAGALLIMAGLGSLMAQFRRSPLGVLGVQLTWVGMLFILLNAYQVLFVFPVYGWEGVGAISAQAAVLNIATIPTVILGPLVLAIAAWRHKAMAWWNAVLLLLSAVAVGVMVVVPELEVPLAISSTIIAGIAYAFAGARGLGFSEDAR
ncbi:MAG: hypothetical protein ABW091_06640 [Microbacterium sp.]